MNNMEPEKIVDFIQVEMNKERFEELWNLYREFCEACNQNNMALYAVEFFAWISKFKLSKSNE